MNRLHRWMIEKFLPRYAHELLLDELAATDKRLAAARQTIAELSAENRALRFALRQIGAGAARNGRARRRMKVTKYCEHCPWRSADPYCLWPRCFKKYLTGPQQERKKQADERIAAGADGQPRN